MSTTAARMSKTEFVARARFRHQLRLFEQFTEKACAAAGVTMPQYMLVLQVRGRPERDWALVGELADCLALKHHTTVELVSRCEAAGLVRRERDPDDQRKVRVLPTAKGARVADRVARAHEKELERLLGHLEEALERERVALVRPAARRRTRQEK
ncbi:MarR family winged helix-turn-helix transcriptional regulator [Ramlibacter humi]|uniref:MarR family transcriptional regulator n=1 Tax=Ramlibacter humi TaxID=2530451 RepID=A0A4Z0BFN3_9BURK|nr:MarR family transcriptional regulator [Ramlibacter humi]TFY97189.1 MarR family transcriptional regulator [Ramlibacter humi]